MLHQKVADEVQQMVEDTDDNNDERRKLSFKSCSSAVFAAQMKKVIPSKIFDNRKSSIEVGLGKIDEIIKQRKSRMTVDHSLSTERSDQISEAQMEELIPKTKEEAVDPEIIKILPVPLSEKKLYRDTLTLPPSKVPWSDKLMQGVKYNYTDITDKFELWQDSLKEIEGYFGAGTVSYFVFLRWLLVLNCFMLVLNFSFLVVPSTILTPVIYSLPENFSVPSIQNTSNLLYKVFEGDFKSENHLSMKYLHSNHSKMTEKDIVKYCHKKYVKEINEARRKGFVADVQNLLQGMGWMEPTIMFSGNYPVAAVTSGGLVYNVPLAFIFVMIAIFMLSFIMMMLYSSSGIYEVMITKTDIATRFANDVFSAWDYCIQDVRNAEVHHRSFYNNLRTTLSEIVFKKEAEARPRRVLVKLYCIRVLVNLVIAAWIVGGFYIISSVVHHQLQRESETYKPGIKTFLMEFLPAVSVTAFRTVSPVFFSYLRPYEKFHARTAVNLSLARSTFLGLSSVFVLVASVQQQILCKPVDICGKGKGNCHAPMCWETYVGQELYKLNFMEFLFSLFFFFLTVAGGRIKKKFRNKFVRWVFSADFFLPKEILGLVYLQTITWLGVLYSPLLPITLVIKLTILFYMKKAVVMKYVKPSTTIYKASRFNSMYILLLMVSFLIVVIIHFHTVTEITPSYGCSPFRFYDYMSDALIFELKRIPHFSELLQVTFTKWLFVPVYMVLGFLIYYNWQVCSTLQISEDKMTAELVLLGKDRQFLLHKIKDLVEEDEEN